jgi:HK97 family phage prohead protease
MDLSKRANLLNVREVRGLVYADPASPTGMLGANLSPMIELRADADDPDFWTFRGEASVIDSPYMVRDMWGEFSETIRAGAFDKTLSENPDVVLNYMHDNSTAMATTRGGGLQLVADPHLAVVARIEKSDVDAQRVMPKVARGDAASMSFAFRVTQQNWNEDYTEREITEVNLSRGDVAVIVTGLGANPAAWGTVRALTDMGLTDDQARTVAEEIEEVREVPQSIREELAALYALKPPHIA